MSIIGVSRGNDAPFLLSVDKTIPPDKNKQRTASGPWFAVWRPLLYVNRKNLNAIVTASHAQRHSELPNESKDSFTLVAALGRSRVDHFSTGILQAAGRPYVASAVPVLTL